MTITRNIPDLVVVITGASAGIGYALAKLLAKDGAKVVLAARTEDKLVSVVEECGGITNALAVKCDVTKRSDHEMVLAAAIEKFGRVDCWINNAGVGMSKPVLEITDEDFDLMMSCNCKSVLYGMQTVVPYYKLHGKGQIINVSSVLGRTPYVSVRCMYGASKHAMNALTANMRLDLQNDGFKDIYIGLFSPGVVATDFGLNSVHAEGGKGPNNRTMPGAQDVSEVAAGIRDQIISQKADVYSREVYAGNKDTNKNKKSANENKKRTKEY